MNLINATRLAAGYTVSTDKTGRSSLVVVAKGSYGVPERPDRVPRLLDEQIPLVMTDVFTGEPGFSAPLHEIDFAPFKLRCDVLLNGSCHAPGGRPAASVPVGMRVGGLSKSFNVVGHRVYEGGLLSCGPGAPRPFEVLPISYDNAYGGVDRSNPDPALHRWHLLNHAGVGYHPGASPGDLDGRPLPNTEELDDKVLRPDGDYRPMALGALGRAWQERVRWAGTYDQAWLDHQCPLFPQDFDMRYFQAAPQDQQTGYLRGGEEVVLVNLSAEGRTAFCMPGQLALAVLVVLKNGEEAEVAAHVDTVLLEPDAARFSLTWRASFPLRRDLFDIRECVVGRTRERSRQSKARDERLVGKRRFASLAALVAWAREQRADQDA